MGIEKYGSVTPKGQLLPLPKAEDSKNFSLTWTQILISSFLISVVAFVGGFALGQSNTILFWNRPNNQLYSNDMTNSSSLVPISCDDLLSSTLGDSFCGPTSRSGIMKIRGLDLMYYEFGQKTEKKNSTPLIVINGGPGFSHTYTLALKQQACYGRQVIFYDQVGTGQSSKPDLEDAPWLLDTDYYIEELESLISFLDFNHVFVLGHSWGGIVALLYGIKRPATLKGLVLAGALSDAQLYVRSQREHNLATLPPQMQQYLISADNTEKYDDMYYRIADHLETLFTIRTFPQPSCVREGFETYNQHIYEAMQGPSEFSVAGVLSDFNCTGNLSQINVPTFITHGRFDTMTTPVVTVLNDHIQGSKLRTYPHSGHLTFVDDAKAYNEDVSLFLKEVDL